MNRLLAALAFLAYTVLLRGNSAFDGWRLATSAWLILSVTIALHILIAPRPSTWRRLVALLLDVSGISIELYAGDAESALLYPVYLWVILGNGLRFGVRYVAAASALSVTGFGFVIIATPFWHEQIGLACGLMAALFVLPAYVFVLTRQIATARRLAEEASQAKNIFLASVSHELRTPLSAITSLTHLLRETGLNRKQVDLVGTMEVSAGILLDQIGELLDFSRIEAGQVRLDDARFSVPGLVAELQRMLAPQARAKGLHLNGFVAARTPHHVRGDARRIREILLNLCGNALKFTASGSVTLAVDGELGTDGVARLRFEVADTGIGIAPEAQGRIFEMFTQADAGILDRFGGTGLGLAICERLVRLMGGAIGVESEPGRGSTFWFELPLTGCAADEPPDLAAQALVLAADPDRAALLVARLGALGVDATAASGHEPLRELGAGAWVALVDQHGPGAGPEVPEGAFAAILTSAAPAAGLPGPEVRERFTTTVSLPGPDSGLLRALRVAAEWRPDAAQEAPARTATHAVPPLRVLVADDNAINQLVVTKILERAGHTVILADNGEQAVTLLVEDAVDVALMDVNMPVLNGIDATRVYRFTPGARIPILGLTADVTPDTARRCLEAGMQACLHKPMRPAELLRALEEAHRDGQPCAPERGPERGPAPAEPPSSLDERVLLDLASLGGRAFVTQVVQEFVLDTERVIDELEASMDVHDLHGFRAQSHALCSSAANVGARSLRELCQPWEFIAAPELEASGPVLLRRLGQEWARTRAALLRHAAADAASLGDVGSFLRH